MSHLGRFAKNALTRCVIPITTVAVAAKVDSGPWRFVRPEDNFLFPTEDELSAVYINTKRHQSAVLQDDFLYVFEGILLRFRLRGRDEAELHLSI